MADLLNSYVDSFLAARVNFFVRNHVCLILCSFSFTQKGCPVSPTYNMSQFLHLTPYTTPQSYSTNLLFLRCTSSLLRALCGLMAVLMLCFLKILWNFSETPCTYGMTTMTLAVSQLVLFCFLLAAFVALPSICCLNLLTTSW